MKFKSLALLAGAATALTIGQAQARQTAPYYGPNTQVTVHCKDGVALTSRYSDFPAMCASHGGTRYPAPYIDPVSVRPRTEAPVKATGVIPRPVPGCGVPASGIQNQNDC